jgi:hypothetical protein
MEVTSLPKDLTFESRLMSTPMAFARFVRQGHPVPLSTKMILYGLEAAQDLMATIRDLRRTVKLVQTGLITLFPDEACGLHLMYSTLDRDLLQVERVGQRITTQLVTAITGTKMSCSLQPSVVRPHEAYGSTGCTWYPQVGV